MAKGKGHGGHGSHGGHKSHGVHTSHKGHGHGFGLHHHHHHHHRVSGRSNRSIEQILDQISNVSAHTLTNGAYTFGGTEMSFRAQYAVPLTESQPSMQQAALMQQQNMTQMYTMEPFSQQNIAMNMMQPNMVINMMPTQNMGTYIQQATITIVGNKTKSGNGCCRAFTFMFSCLIFPLFFTCCEWWKKIVNPIYQLTTEAYRDVGRFISLYPTITNLNLAVADNAFNAEKANILQQILSRSLITNFTFTNRAVAFNGSFNEANDFLVNVIPIKSLNIATSLTWGQMVA